MWLIALAIVLAAPAWAAAAPRGTHLASTAERVATPADSARFGNSETLARYARGRLLEERGSLSEAMSEYYRAMVGDPHALAPARRASEVAARMGDANRSLEFADKALAIEPRDAHSLWLRGAALFGLGRTRESLASLEAAVAADPDRAGYWRTMARAAEQAEDYDALARAWRGAVTLDPDDGEGWFQLAAALARSGNFASADSAIHYAREIDADRAGLDFLAAWIDEALGRDEAAAEGYARHLKLHPNDELTRQRRIALLDQLGRHAEAYREARELAGARPRDAEALETEADLAYRTGRGVEGRQHLDALMRLDPSDSRLVARALGVLARHKRTSEGVTLAREWSERHSGDWRGPMLQAQAHALAGSFDRAIERARISIDLAPDSIAARVMLGRIAQQAKQWPTAAATWSELLARRPGEVGFRLDLAYCREQSGDIDGALAAARDALALAPRQPSVLNFLGYLLADHNRELGEAEKMVQQAVDQEPENGAFIDSLGWVFYRLGRLDDARRELERAVAMTRGDPIVLEHLGDVYRDLHLLDLARNLYRRSIAADTSNQRVRDKLEATR